MRSSWSCCFPEIAEKLFNPVDSYIWFELYGSPSDRDVDLIGSVIQSWYVMGRLGALTHLIYSKSQWF
ncbi:hypothetical protein CK203_014597 [Vitis vinifera]|uniref:Uncharacterized protein n=1 Tax=Vitis vinifera TaxID=29760 RepID=A0A438K564_VITVI|nr:hypothetical protein CK203_014597 [Vitis vinifera]